VIDVSDGPERSYAVCGLQVDTDFSEEHAIIGAGISSLLIPSERKNSFQILHLFFTMNAVYLMCSVIDADCLAVSNTPINLYLTLTHTLHWMTAPRIRVTDNFVV
jgi:hypothetical protein